MVNQHRRHLKMQIKWNFIFHFRAWQMCVVSGQVHTNTFFTYILYGLYDDDQKKLNENKKTKEKQKKKQTNKRKMTFKRMQNTQKGQST